MIDWDKHNYPKELEGVPYRYVGKNVKLYKNGRVFVASRNKIKEKKPRYNDKYFAIGVRYEEGTKSRYIHRLVAKEFVPNPENKNTVNHIDGDKTNNSCENLEWLTHHENLLHASEIGLTSIGNKHWRKKTNSKLEEDEIKMMIAERVAKYKTKTRSIGGTQNESKN